jgi:DNA-binding NtrC family response regulator
MSDDVQGTTIEAPLDRKATEASTFRLVVTEGPQKGASVLVRPDSPGPVSVGSAPGCDLVLGDRLVSRRHASFEAGVRSLRVLDLGSTNGTVVNGLRVADATLEGGEVVRLGESLIRVERTGEDEGKPTPLWPVDAFGRFLGTSSVIRRLYPLLQKVAASNLPVILQGETGTGKELLAESIHELGPRRNQAFVVFDCSAAGKESEAILFGEEERGKVKRRGVFDEADRGTLLLDEISELPLALQAKLLRVLERGEVCRVGGDRWIKTDARVVATTRRNVDREVELGKFRDDLFFRLSGLRVTIPPLRDRQGDVRFLAAHFWKQVSNDPLPEELITSFEGYGWPGNVRELANAVARRASLGELYPAGSDGPTPIDLTTDSKVFERVFALNLPLPEARARVVAEFERYFVEKILAKHNGNVSHAAAASGIARRYFQIIKTRARET